MTFHTLFRRKPTVQVHFHASAFDSLTEDDLRKLTEHVYRSLLKKRRRGGSGATP